MRIFVARKSGGLGDIVCCEPVVRGLRARYPDAAITFAMPREYVCLFDGRTDAVFRGLDPNRFTARWLAQYERENDVFIDLCGPEAVDERHGSPPISRTESFCVYAGVDATQPAIYLRDSEIAVAQEVLSEHETPWIGFAAESPRWTKRWFREGWTALAEAAPGTKLYLADAKGQPVEDTVPLLGKPLREVAAILSQLDLLVSIDTGLLHLAGALGTKTVSLWGPTDPLRTLRPYPGSHFVDPEPYRSAAGCSEPCLNNPKNCTDLVVPLSKCMALIDPGVVTQVVQHALKWPGEDAEATEENLHVMENPGKPRLVWVCERLLPARRGAERYAAEAIEHLRNTWDVVAIWSRGDELFKEISVEQRSGVTWVRCPEGALAAKVTEAEPEVVVTQLGAASKVARSIPSTTRLVLILHSVGEHFNEGQLRSGQDELFCRADVLVANSKAMADIVRAATGRNAVIQYPVVDRGRCESRESLRECCVAIGVNSDRGREFLERLALKMPDERFLWVDGEKPVPGNVEVVDYTEDLRGIFSRALVNLTPHTEFQAFGRTPVEAGWAGVPTLTLDNGGLPEAVGSGGVVMPDDVMAWVAMIRRLRSDARFLEALSAAARSHAASFTWDALDAALAERSRPKAEPKEPKVSVIIPTYNRLHLLPDAVDSVLAQRWNNIEAIVVDDGSQDETRRLVEQRYGGEERVRYVRKDNGGCASALNRGIEEADGDYICWLSDDDFFIDPEKTAKQVAAFKSGASDLRLVHTSFESHWSGDGAKWSGEAGRVTPWNREPVFTSKEQRYKANVEECLINGSTVMLDARIFKEVGKFNPCYRYCQDYDMWLRILRKYDAVFLPDVTIARHEHKDILGKEVLGTKQGRALWDLEKKRVVAAARMTEPARPQICAELCVKNEREHIGRCLDDITQWADKIVIFDDGSTDGSRDIMRSYAKLADLHEGEDRGNTRIEGRDRQRLLEMAQATGCKWICFIDADEVFENRFKWEIYDHITADVNLWYFLEVNFWRGTSHYRVDELWYKGWFGRLFRNLPGLAIWSQHDEHCGGIPHNIPDAPQWPIEGTPKALKSEVRMKHYGFADWRRTVRRARERWQRDPYQVMDGVERGGFVFYERMIDERDLELCEYEGDDIVTKIEEEVAA